MSHSLSEWAKRIHDQTQAKRNWSHTNTAEHQAEYIVDEARELVEAIQNPDADAFSVGSELADLLYLTLYICEELGFKPDDLLVMKTLRNDIKYPTDVNSNNGGYNQAREVSKKFYQGMGGDAAFSNWYMEVAEDLS